MVFRRKKTGRKARGKSASKAYAETLKRRLETIDGYDFDDEEAGEVEARLRSMFYGTTKKDDLQG